MPSVALSPVVLTPTSMRAPFTSPLSPEGKVLGGPVIYLPSVTRVNALDMGQFYTED